jgi:hypothetical protein
MMQQHHRSYVDADGAVVIGRLRVGPKELGFGSAGEDDLHTHLQQQESNNNSTPTGL